jgi:hypothetical protein
VRGNLFLLGRLQVEINLGQHGGRPSLKKTIEPKKSTKLLFELPAFFLRASTLLLVGLNKRDFGRRGFLRKSATTIVRSKT